MRMEANEKLLAEEELHSVFELLRELTVELELSEIAACRWAVPLFTQRQ